MIRVDVDGLHPVFIALFLHAEHTWSLAKYSDKVPVLHDRGSGIFVKPAFQLITRMRPMLRPVSGLSFLSRMMGFAFGIFVLFATLIVLPAVADAQSNVRPPSSAEPSEDPTTTGKGRDNLSNALGTSSDSDFWRKLREGQSGSTQVRSPAAGQAMRAPGERLTSEQAIRDAVAGGGALSRVTSPNLSGDGWRSIRNDILPRWGGYAMGGMVALLALFFLIRGKIRVDHGMSGFTVTRFMTIERIGHWLLAVSFIILAITGLLITYGNSLLGTGYVSKSLFATLAIWGKFLHNYVAFAFMVGLAMILVMWVKHNLPSRTDIVWILKGGGILAKGVHPPAKKFNFGQKIIFWLVLLGGISISMSGIALMFPYQTAMFGKTFALLNSFGFSFETALTAVQEQQLASLWHAAMAIFLIAVIVAHIYIGSVGMEGAFDAMGTGEVDVNWAKEHHSIWYEEVASKEQGRKNPSGADPAAAE